MATTVTRYVNPAANSGGNGTTSALTSVDNTHAYNSLQAWETARARDLVAADEIEHVICATSGPSYPKDTTCSVYQTWKTDNLCYIIIEGESSQKANALWDSQKYTIETGSGAARAILVDSGAGSSKPIKIIIDGIQILGTSTRTSSPQYGIEVKNWNTGDDVTVRNCHFRNENANVIASSGVHSNEGATGRTLTIYNSVFNGWKNGTTSSQAIYAKLNDVNIYNVTIYDCYYGINRVSGTCVATNCGIAECTDPVNGTVTETTNSYDTPTFSDEGGGDFHLDSTDTTWIGAGTDLSGTFTTDIDGETRTSWDIGADEFVPGPISINVSDCANPICVAWQ